VRAKNGADVYGNAATVTTAPGDSGNHTEEGEDGKVQYINIPGVFSVNGKNFNQDEKFPTTAFKNASFVIKLTNGESSKNYDWFSDSGVVSVSDGVVNFNSMPSRKQAIKIWAIEKNIGAKRFMYTFSINEWFTNEEDRLFSFDEAYLYCRSQNASLPNISDLTHEVGKRDVGSLYSEWGNMSKYKQTGFIGNGSYFSTDGGYYVNLNTGRVTSSSTANKGYLTCIHDI